MYRDLSLDMYYKYFLLRIASIIALLGISLEHRHPLALNFKYEDVSTRRSCSLALEVQPDSERPARKTTVRVVTHLVTTILSHRFSALLNLPFGIPELD